MGIETAIGGIGALGLAGSAANSLFGKGGLFGGSNKPDEATMAYQIDGNNQARKAQEDALNYQKNLQAPYIKGGQDAYYQMLSAITGKPQSYADPNYTALSDQERNQYAWSKVQQDPSLMYQDKNFLRGIQAGIDPVSLINGSASLRALGEGYYKAPDGSYVKDVPTVTTPVWEPTDTPAYQWQQQQMEKNTGRTLRSLGRANSTYGMNVIADKNKDLAATEYDKQLSRLADLTNMARGSASSLGAAAGGTGNQLSNLATLNGTNMTNAMLSNSMMNQNQSYNNQQTGFGLANSGLKAYDYGKNAGWWGGDNQATYEGLSSNIGTTGTNINDLASMYEAGI